MSTHVQKPFSKKQNVTLITLCWENFHLYYQVKVIQWFSGSFIILDNEKTFVQEREVTLVEAQRKKTFSPACAEWLFLVAIFL